MKKEKLEQKAKGLMAAGEFYADIGPAMAKIRTNNDISQGLMAKVTGVSRSHINQLEQGKENISAYLVYCYCSLLSVSPETFYRTGQGDSMPYLSKVENDIKQQFPDLKGDDLDRIVSIIRNDLM